MDGDTTECRDCGAIIDSSKKSRHRQMHSEFEQMKTKLSRLESAMRRIKT